MFSPTNTTIFYYWILPAVLFSAYLIYGLIRPLLSVARRKAVEEALDSQGEEREEGAGEEVTTREDS